MRRGGRRKGREMGKGRDIGRGKWREGKGRDRRGEGIGEGGEGKGREWKGLSCPLPCPLTLSCPPNAEFLDPPMLLSRNFKFLSTCTLFLC